MSVSRPLSVILLGPNRVWLAGVCPTGVWRTSVAVVTLLVAILLSPRVDASEDLHVDLYTIGQGNYLYASYGHTAICVGRSDGQSAARCYDYGLPDNSEFLHVAWTAIREQPSFVPTAVNEEWLVAAFREQERSIERQRLPLDQSQAQALAAMLERDVAERRIYAYHPYWANCTTKVRDLIDQVLGGELSKATEPSGTMTFRQHAEAAFSGRLFKLGVLALLLGAPDNDRIPSRFEAMFLPAQLRDFVSERFGVAPETLHPDRGMVIGASPAVGRGAWIGLGLLLFGLVRLGRRWLSGEGAIILVAVVLGSLGMVVLLTSSLVAWPEVRFNWALALLLPTDLMMPRLRAPWLTRYLLARLSVVIALAALSLLGAISQPLWALALLAGLPLFGLLRRLGRDVESKITPAADARATAT